MHGRSEGVLSAESRPDYDRRADPVVPASLGFTVSRGDRDLLASQVVEMFVTRDGYS